MIRLDASKMTTDSALISTLAERTVHHKGALSVYSGLLGKASTMPYWGD